MYTEYIHNRLNMKSSTVQHVFLGVAVVVIMTLLVSGLLLIDSPVVARQKTWDNEKQNELRQLRDQIGYEFDMIKSLPQNLFALDLDQSLIMDDQNHKPYEYRILEDTKFELCADFNLASTDSMGDPNAYVRYPGSGFDNFDHKAGRNCYTLEVTPSDEPFKQVPNVRVVE